MEIKKLITDIWETFQNDLTQYQNFCMIRGKVTIIIFTCALLLFDASISLHPLWSGNVANIWTRATGGKSFDEGNAISRDPSGNILVTGNFSGAVDFGGSPISSFGERDVFIVKYSADGSHLWSKGFGGVSQDSGFGILCDPSGNIIVTGRFRDTVNFGGSPITSNGQSDVFVAKYTSNGNHIWSLGFGGVGEDVGYALATDSAGNIFITGAFENTVDFGLGPISSKGGKDIFIVNLNANGILRFSKGLGGSEDDAGLALVSDGFQNIIVTGEFREVTDFGGGLVASKGESDIFIAKYNTDGTYLWSRQIGGDGSDRGCGITEDMNGNIIVTGGFEKTVDFGEGPVTSSGGQDIFIAMLDEYGIHNWSLCAGDSKDDIGYGIEADSYGNIIATGSFSGVIDLGSGVLLSSGLEDIFIAKFDTFGAPMFSRQIGGLLSEKATGLRVDSSGNIYLTGSFRGSVDFGNGMLTSGGENDIFTARYFSPDEKFPPAADAGPDKIVFDTIILDASGSSDPDNDISTYVWHIQNRMNPSDSRTATGEVITLTDVNYGFYDVILTVTDISGLSDTDSLLFSATGPKGDFDFDGDVDGQDLSEFSGNFGK